MESPLDLRLARLLELPGSPLVRWPCWKGFHAHRPKEARLLSIMFAAGIRESWEEIRLNPFRLRFLGPLPSQSLVLFNRVIHPMAVWVGGSGRFRLGSEVEEIVPIPLRCFADSSSYAVYRLHADPGMDASFAGGSRDFPCFIYSRGGQNEVLWGVTYRIVDIFLETVFGFRTRSKRGGEAPVVAGRLDETYLNGHQGD